MLRAYFGEILFHRPERSGLPSGVRGAGAARFGLLSAVRGMPGVGCVSHCAAAGVDSAVSSIAKATVFMAYLLRQTMSRGLVWPVGTHLIHPRLSSSQT